MLDRAPRRLPLAHFVTRRGWVALVAFAAACSVYSSELVDGAADGIDNGGGGGSNAAGATTGGKPNATAGSGDAPSTGDGGTPDTGDGGDGPTPEGGAGASAGGAAGGSAGGSTPGGTAGAATGGGSGTSGTAGNGGGPVDGVELFDDFEDRNLTIEPGAANDRSGVWYFFDDGKAGTMTPDPLVAPATLSDAPEALGTRGLHMTATGFATQGTGLGADFVDGKEVYDISKFKGLRFWARVGSGKNTKHRVQISDVTTEAAGMKCKTASGTPNDQLCGNHWGIGLTLTTSWKAYEVLFANLKQLPGWGKTAAAIDPTQVYGLQITAGPDLEVDLWVDQFELF